MLRLLTRGSRMRSLYLQYLKERSKKEETANAIGEVVEAIRNLVVGEQKDSDKSKWHMKKKFERFRRSLKGLSTDPNCA